MSYRGIKQAIFLRRLLAYLLVLKYVQALKDIYSYNAGNQLILENGSTYAYDKNGNLTSKTDASGTATYFYDFENRLIKSVMPNGTVAEFKYDPFGRRIEKKVTENGITTTKKYFYDNEDILFEYGENGNVGNRYIHGLGIDEPLALIDGKNTYYYHADGLGSIVALTDSNQKVVQTYEYDSFGNHKDQKERIKQPYTFTAREWDKEIGTFYLRNRTLDPKGGRFTTKDPMTHPTNGLSANKKSCKNSAFNATFGGYLLEPIKLNPYVYVEGNPINKTDPMGLLSCNGEWRQYGYDRVFNFRCKCYWLCVPCNEPTIWSGNFRNLPFTYGNMINSAAGSGTGVESGDDCLCDKPGPDCHCD